MSPDWPVRGIEGVVAKRLNAPYRPGRGVGSPWVKVKQRVIGDARVIGVLGDVEDLAAVVLAALAGDARPVGVSAPLAARRAEPDRGRRGERPRRELAPSTTVVPASAPDPRALPGEAGLPRWLDELGQLSEVLVAAVVSRSRRW